MRSHLCCIMQIIFSHVLRLGINTDTELKTEVNTELFVSGIGKY